MNSDLFITGTDTGVGKTVLSALLVATFGRKYWKPIQTGAREGTDRQTVMSWADITADQAYPETYLFDPPVSPHLAAKQQGRTIDLQRIRRPASADPIIIEGAGGVLVPINENAFMLDLIGQLGAPAIVASRTALGTINHTLLTVSAIRQAKLTVHGVVMIGTENVENRLAIERYGDVPVIGWIPWLDKIDRDILQSVFENRFDKNAFV
ncbi:MAG: dethiobiotin synthase [Acidobacteria bacterium]|nr:MAG: dethiobiotin synthase [Acidobacteriota bacterium]